MTMLETSPPATSAHDRRRRASARRRGLLAALVTGALAWSLVSFLSDTGATTPVVTTVPGTGPDGSIGTVATMSANVTAPKGNAQLQEGIAFARLDIATAFHQNVAVALGWVNPRNFSVQTQTANWQIRLGLYYPVRTGACTTSDPVHAVTLPLDDLTTAETVEAVDHCLYRDLEATGPGVSLTDTPAVNHVGTQMLAINRLTATLRPQKDLSPAVACTATTDTDGCLPAGTDTDARPMFVVGSLLNPGGPAPPGGQATIDGLRLHVTVSQS